MIWKMGKLTAQPDVWRGDIPMRKTGETRHPPPPSDRPVMPVCLARHGRVSRWWTDKEHFCEMNNLRFFPRLTNKTFCSCVEEGGGRTNPSVRTDKSAAWRQIRHCRSYTKSLSILMSKYMVFCLVLTGLHNVKWQRMVATAIFTSQNLQIDKCHDKSWQISQKIKENLIWQTFEQVKENTVISNKYHNKLGLAQHR
jgi:hypothetical protein